jgi:hypothetical protein
MSEDAGAGFPASSLICVLKPFAQAQERMNVSGGDPHPARELLALIGTMAWTIDPREFLARSMSRIGIGLDRDTTRLALNPRCSQDVFEIASFEIMNGVSVRRTNP